MTVSTIDVQECREPQSAIHPKRRPWVAFLLSLLYPGLGHLYAGFLRKTVYAVLLWAIIVGVFFWISGQPYGSPVPMVLGAALALGSWLAIALHAALIAHAGTPLPFRRWLRIASYLLYFFLLSAAGSCAADLIRAHYLESFYVPMAGMYPTIHAGDYLYVRKGAYEPGQISRGDVIVFTVPRGRPIGADPTLVTYVKRVVGLPGDHVEFRSGTFYLDGVEVPTSFLGLRTTSDEVVLRLYSESLNGREYTVAHDPKRKHLDAQGRVIPPGQLFVVGDNRDRSYDTRKGLTVPLDSVIGKALQPWFSVDPNTGTVQWNRIGLRIE